MSKFAITATALLALALFSTSSQSADAQGIHFNTGRLHVDIGNPHGGFHHGHGHNQRRVQSYYGRSNFGHSTHYPSHRSRGWGQAHSWHDTSHYDWHPTEIRRHGNHFHVQPGHYYWHQEGHVDHHHN